MLTLAIPLNLEANDASYVGPWILSLQDDQRTLIGLLEIEKVANGWRAFLEGGPVEINIEQDQIEIVADSRDVRGFVFDRRMTGMIINNQMHGSYKQEGAAAQKEAPGTWSAVRKNNKDSELKSVASQVPMDISGIWTATQELDFRKYTMSLTQNGKDWLEQYLPYYDQPDVRCTSIGLPALATYSFPLLLKPILFFLNVTVASLYLSFPTLKVYFLFSVVSISTSAPFFLILTIVLSLSTSFRKPKNSKFSLSIL